MTDFGSSNDQMLEMFLFEMSSLLEQLDDILLTSEKNQTLTQESINEVFRIMHTIKGSSAMMEFMVIAAVTHKLEDSFFIIRDKGIDQAYFTQLFDLMLDATDFLKSQLEAIQNGTPLSEGNDELVARAMEFLSILKGEKVPAPDASIPETPAPAPAPEEQAHEEEQAATQAPVADEAPDTPAADMPVVEIFGGDTYHVDVLFEEDCGMENLRAFMLINTLKQNCVIVGFEPSDIETNPETASFIMVNGFSIMLQTELDADRLQEIIDHSMHVKTASLTLMDNASVNQKAQDSISGAQYAVHVNFEEDCGMENLRSFMLINSLRSKCGILNFEPSDIETNPLTASFIMQNGFDILLETPMSKEELQKMIENSMHVRNASVSKLHDAVSAPVQAAQTSVNVNEIPTASAPVSEAAPVAAQPAAAPPAPVKAAVPAKAASAPVKAAPASPAPAPAAPVASNKPIKQNLINVNLSKLDELMDIMGELVITESMVTRSPDLKGISQLENFNKAARQLRKLTDELQDMVMSIRMVPVAGTFQKMTRIVRDMCRNLGKEADLITMGEETDIDKTIIDGIADPIMHLVRNSMDHGVETPEQRVAAGKSPKATVTLSAQNTGGEILITVSDDGKGLDSEALLAKAKKSGILTKPANEYTEKESFQLLMMPGFSTNEVVTEYSGRGVGMDVVKKNIEKVGGTVAIESKKGHGMSVFLKIPLTLAIVDGMDIMVGDGTYTLQITAINESFKATRDQIIVDTEGNEMILMRGDVYPIIRLHELYQVPNAITDIEQGILIWVQSGDASAVLFVDQLIGEQQIVVKPLPAYLGRYDIKPYGIAGCTILGDGNISLILDVGYIIEKAMEKR